LILVQKQDFDVGAELKRLRNGDYKIGGICSFVGCVRDLSGNEMLKALTLQHYPEMTEKELHKIEVEAHKRWPLEASLIIHRYGRLEPGEQIVLVITASAHRKAAFESCEFLIDYLKTCAPFWKNEDDGSVKKWVDARETDELAVNKWKKNNTTI
tara:strand:- start:63 stop:527 length:465 start_codon:yes stop_codon:yes gene_type:complete